MDFSKRLRELREKKGLSQEALAELLNINRTSITHYENSNDRIPRPKRLKEIAEFFGVTVDYLMGRADTNELTKTEENFFNLTIRTCVF
jgi:transcriptional regulator with XRE-family HTH domain